MDIGCVFCDKTKFGDRLVGENRDWYVVVTLGQIIGGYVLIIPKEHVLCMGALPSHQPGNQTETLLTITKEVCGVLALEYQHNTSGKSRPFAVFEHGIVGQTVKHAHLHLLPVVIDLTKKIRADFPKTEFEELRDAAHLQELYSRRLEPYLFWTIPNGTAMVCWNPPAPPQYLRLVAAELLGHPERGNWRDMDPDLDGRLVQETVSRLRPYFS